MDRSSRARGRIAGAAGWVLLVAGCNGPGTQPPESGPVAIVTVAPAAAVLVPGETVALTGVARDRGRNPLPDERVTWRSSDGSVAGVGPAGVVSAVGPGQATVTATTEGISATAQIQVEPGGVVGSDGGTVASADGRAHLVVPAGAVAAPTVFRFGPPLPPPLDPTATADAVSVHFTGPLARPAALVLTYDPATGPRGVAESALGVRRLSANRWVITDQRTVDPAAHSAQALITESGTYGVGRIPPSPACTAPEYRQFDFWLGRWAVTPTDSGPEARVARSSISAEPGGCAIFEDFRDLNAVGLSISLFDPVTARWYQTFVDNSGTRLELIGALVGSAMLLTEADSASRITWTASGGAVRQFGEDSEDGGATWDPGFDLTYRPR